MEGPGGESGRLKVYVDDVPQRFEADTKSGTNTLAIRHPAFLDRERDLYVGLFGATPFGAGQKALLVRDLRVTVRTFCPPRTAGRAG